MNNNQKVTVNYEENIGYSNQVMPPEESKEDLIGRESAVQSFKRYCCNLTLTIKNVYFIYLVLF